MKVLLLFIDGLGIGERDLERNPLARYPSKYLSIFKDDTSMRLPNGGVVIPTRVDMGVPGLPQSATGQTAIFTGKNAAQALGHHMSGFPTPTLRKLLDEHSLFKAVKQMGKTAAFANALSKEYFERRGEWISATTRALLAGGFAWFDLQDLNAGRAVSHDLTNEFLREMKIAAPLRTVQEGAAILAEIAQQFDFTLFEFLLTDFVGHSRDFDGARDVIHGLDTLLEVVLNAVDLREIAVVLTSDHGNFEDLGTKTHTYNEVPTCIWVQESKMTFPPRLNIEEVAGLLLGMLRE